MSATGDWPHCIRLDMVWGQKVQWIIVIDKHAEHFGSETLLFGSDAWDDFVEVIVASTVTCHTLLKFWV